MKPNIKTLRRAKPEADFARSGVVSNRGGASSTIPRLGSGLFGLSRVVVRDFPPFFPHLVSFWGLYFGINAHLAANPTPYHQFKGLEKVQ